MPRILKFGPNVGYDSLYCGKEMWPAAAYSFIHLSILLSLQGLSFEWYCPRLYVTHWTLCLLFSNTQSFCKRTVKALIRLHKCAV